MRSTRRFSSARFAAAIVAALALIIGPTVAALPAAAATTDLKFEDRSGNTLSGLVVEYWAPFADGIHHQVTTDGGGFISLVGFGTGDFMFRPVDTTMYTGSAFIHTNASVPEGSTVVFDVVPRVIGSVPAGAANGLTTVNLYYYNGAGWVATGSPYSVSGSTFSIPLTNGNVSYTLYLTEAAASPYQSSYNGGTDDPNSSQIFSPGLSGVVNLYEVTLRQAGTISGTVTRTDTAPVSGATVHARSSVGGVDHTTTTDSSGNYSFKLDLNLAYELWIAETPWITQYFDEATGPAMATLTTLSAGSPTATGRDFVLDAVPPTLSGTVVTGPAINIKLYVAEAENVWTLVDSANSTDNFSFSNLENAYYRIGLQNQSTGDWLPWSSAEQINLGGTSTISPATTNNECYIELFLSPELGDFTLNDIELDGVSAGLGECQGPTAPDYETGTVSGHVGNYDDVDGAITAELYTWDGVAADDTLVGTDTVDASGNYSIGGVVADGKYYVALRVDAAEQFLDTYIGGVWLRAPGAMASAYASGAYLLSGRNLSHLDGSLLPAATFSGTVSSAGAPLPGVCVSVYDPIVEVGGGCVDSDSAGKYVVKRPLGHSYLAFVDKPGYGSAQYYSDGSSYPTTLTADSSNDVFTHVDFVLTGDPAAIAGIALDASENTLEGITAHLYKRTTGQWDLVDSDTTSAGAGWEFVDITNGDYQVRFEDAAGDWYRVIGSRESDGVVLPDDYEESGLCYLQFDDVTDGPPHYAVSKLEASETCGPGDGNAVEGRLVETQELSGGAPIAGHDVYLFDEDESSRTVTTDADGYYRFDDVVDGEYWLEIYPSEHTSGSGEHSYEGMELVVHADGGAHIDDIELARYGNIYGSITNWNPSMIGTQVLAVREESGVWNPTAFVIVTVANDGTYDVPGIEIDGQYSVYIMPPESSPYLGAFAGGGLEEPGSAAIFTGTAEDDYHSLATMLPLAHTIKGSVVSTGHTLGLTLVFALTVPDGELAALTYVNDDGSYTIKVPPGQTYQLTALSAGYLPQSWLGHNGCTCSFDPVVIPSGDTSTSSNYNFNLVKESDVVEFSLEFSTIDGDPVEGAIAHLYKKSGDGWVEVAHETSDVDGYVSMLGRTDGDYRVALSRNGTWLTLSGACYDKFLDTVRGDYYEDEYDVDELTPAGLCSKPAAPTSPGGGGGGSGDGGGGGDAETVDVTVTPTSTPTPTPTPTPSATPGDDTDGTGGTDEPGATDPSGPAAPSLPWVPWLLVVLGILGVCGIGWAVIRRR